MDFAQLATATLALVGPHLPSLLKITADKSAAAIGEKLVPDAIKNLWQTVTGKLQHTDDGKKALAKAAATPAQAAERLKLPLQDALEEDPSFAQTIQQWVQQNAATSYIVNITGDDNNLNQGTGNSITVTKP